MVRHEKRQRGDGITEREITHRTAETPSEALAALDETDSAIAAPLASLRNRIAAAALAYQDWRAENPNADRGRETFPDLLLQVQYAGEDMERALSVGDAERAAAMAAGAGELLALLWFKHNWQAEALAGDRFLTKASKGGKARAETFETRHYLIRADYAANLERLKHSGRAKEATAKKFGIGRSQLNKVLAK